jgi:hypothetical protein
MQDSELDGFFSAARAAAPAPSAALLDRIEADARHELALRSASVPTRRPGLGRPAGWLARLIASIGGLPAAGGLAAATVAGLWIGLAQPAALGGLTAALGVPSAADAGLDRVELIPSLDPFATEG